jgi:hypothetical protein
MRIFRFSLAFAVVVLASAVLLSTNFAKAGHGDDDDKKSPTPPGLFITPTALKDAVQQDLNPGFALPYFATNYPNFVAGEAVKAVVSPDGTTLAVLTAGFNSLYFPNTDDLTDPNLGKVDKTASTQFLFLYDIAGANKAKPALKQVIQQLNAHVGLVWAPSSQTRSTHTPRVAAILPSARRSISATLRAGAARLEPLPMRPASVSPWNPMWLGWPFPPTAELLSRPITTTIRLA